MFKAIIRFDDGLESLLLPVPSSRAHCAKHNCKQANAYYGAGGRDSASARTEFWGSIHRKSLLRQRRKL
jgi:hypothetical protein